MHFIFYPTGWAVKPREFRAFAATVFSLSVKGGESQMASTP